MKTYFFSCLLFILSSLPTSTHAFFNEWSDFNKRMRQEVWQGLNTPSNNKANPFADLPDGANTSDQTRTPKKPRLTDIKGTLPQAIYDVRDYLLNIEHFKKAGAKLPTGILLCGKPGTGKTSIARALAAEVDAPFFTAKGSEFIELYVGVGAQRIRELFNKVRESLKKTKAPFAIIFIDEIDALGKRDRGISCGEEERTIGELLTQMDGFDTQHSIIVIGATNRADQLDAALLRPGRLEEIIEIPLPAYESRLEILNYYLSDPKFHRSTSGAIALETIARGTHGLSGAELESIINQAALIAARARRSSITQADLDAAYLHVRNMRR